MLVSNQNYKKLKNNYRYCNLLQIIIDVTDIPFTRPFKKVCTKVHNKRRAHYYNEFDISFGCQLIYEVPINIMT